MKIGSVDLGEKPLLLAPMEDITDVTFRLLCREQGADMVYTEFESSYYVYGCVDMKADFSYVKEKIRMFDVC